LLSLVGGVLNLPGVHTLADFVGRHAVELNLGVAAISTAVALAGVFAAWAIYSRGRLEIAEPDRLAALPLRLFVHAHRKWYWDGLYDLIAVRPYGWLADKLAFTVDGQFWHDFMHDSVLVEPFKATASFVANPIDVGVIDGTVNGVARLIENGSLKLRKTQSGYVRNYALLILLGVAAVLAWLIFH
jgi:NADH-quinone oxidoreductase subunit L